MLKSFKVEIDPTSSQKRKIHQSIGVCRWLYNQYIEKNKKLYESKKNGEIEEDHATFMSANDFDKYINNEVKVQPEFSWIDDCGSKARKKILVNAEIAFKRFFKGISGFPRFKKKRNNDVSLYFPKNNKTDWKIYRNKIQIPTLKEVRLKEFGYIPLNVKVVNGVVSFHAGRYYVSVLVELPDVPYVLPQNEGIGIDLGVKELAILSTGDIYENLNKTPKMRKLEKSLKHLQRCLSRQLENKKKRGDKSAPYSANIGKTIAKIQRQYQRIMNLRVDYENKIISLIIKREPSFITIEDLNVSGMLKNHHLSNAIRKQRFYSFRQKLEAKCRERGIELRLVSRFYPSSKLCHECGYKKVDLKLSDRVFVCPCCGNIADRDYNASLNLRDANEYRLA